MNTILNTIKYNGSKKLLQVITINVWHPVTHIQKYLDLDIMVLSNIMWLNLILDRLDYCYILDINWHIMYSGILVYYMALVEKYM